MKRSLTYVLTVLALVVSLAVSCNKDRARVIPRSKLAKIYAEMFITDQWIQNTPNVRTIADTSLVYEPILQKYGFTLNAKILAFNLIYFFRRVGIL